MVLGNLCKSDLFSFEQGLVDAIPVPVFVQDTTGVLLGANLAFRRYFEIRQDALGAIDLYGLLGEDTAQKSRELDDLILGHCGEERSEVTVPCSGKRERRVIFHKAALLGNDGQVVALVSTLLDRTKQRETEQQLRHAQKMEAIGTLAGGIAHDFNNVLTPIIGYAEIMRLMAKRERNPDRTALQFVGEILTAAKRARSLVEQILTFSSAQERPELPQYLHPIVREVLKLLYVTLPASIEVSEELQTDCGMVSIDPVQLHQVLLNLCTNSAQAIGDKQGKITVTLAVASRDAEGKEWVELRVADNGPGIPVTLQDRVFEPYFTTKEKGQGTGMGLAMVHGIVRKCGGRIELWSEEGLGTIFHLYFPRVSSKGVEGKVGGGEAVGIIGNEHIMVVDDQYAVLRVTQKILETLGYRVTSCISSREALTLFKKETQGFDLVITDLTMPQLAGIELCAEIKKQRADIPVILCSGYGAKLSEKELETAGFTAWFTKPVTLQKLASMVRLALDQPH